MRWQDESAPDGWTVCALGELTTVVGGGTPKTSVPGNFSEDGGHPWITPADLTGYTDRYIARGRRALTDQGLDSSSAKYLPAGAVLFSSRAPIGYRAIAANPLTTNQGFRSFVPGPRLDGNYLYHALKFLQPVAEQAASGTTFPELSGRNAAKIRIAFPSLPEQKALALVLDRASDLGDRATSALEGALSSVARLRSAVLVAGCAGQLTADWRPRQVMPSDQQQTETEKAHQPDGRGSLPPGWSWAAIGDVADVEVGGTPSRKNSAYWGGGIPWTSSGEVANCRISETRETISDEGLANSNAKRYPVGTVLIAMIGEGKTRGQSAILDITATTNQNVAGIIPKPSVLMSEYVWRWALGQYEITRAVGRGGNQAALNRKKVKELLIPVPPLAEQQEIVDRVDRLFAIANTLEKRIDAAARRADDVFDAVLAKAFKGELDVGLDEAD